MENSRSSEIFSVSTEKPEGKTPEIVLSDLGFEKQNTPGKAIFKKEALTITYLNNDNLGRLS